MLLVEEKTKKAVTVPSILNVDRMLADIKSITDSGRQKKWTAVQVGLSILRNLRPEGVPAGLTPWSLAKIMDGHTGGKLGFAEKNRYPWRVFFIGGMWFQDLFNYDFRRTEQCIIPYATQEGEISFCAYNTGVGWRNIIEKMHMTSTLTKWYEEHGRHEIFAGGKKVGLEKEAKYDLVLNDEHVNAAANDTFEKSGVAKNSREEKIRARDAKIKQDAENARMAKLYRKEVLGEQEQPGFISLGEIKPAAPVAPVEETVSGD
jgi:hypothetical protein